jgi:hypothetical protein
VDGGRAESERDLVARLFRTRSGYADVRQANAAYPWVTTGRVYWVYEEDRVVVVAVSGDGTSPVRLTGDSAAVANFVRQSTGKFIGFGALAKLLADVYLHPGATIATPDLLLDPADLRDWMKGREKDPAVFRNLCNGIQGSQRENEWQLQFNVFNPNGGVDGIRASGTVSPFTIRQLRVVPLKPAGDFHYPFAG